MIVDGRVGRLEVYNELLKKTPITAYELSDRLNISVEQIEEHITDLRRMFKEDEVGRYICASNKGYYLSNDSIENDDDERLGLRQRRSGLTGIENTDLNNPFDNSSFNQNFVTEAVNVNDKILTLDIKKNYNKKAKLLKINIHDENSEVAFSLTIGLENYKL